MKKIILFTMILFSSLWSSAADLGRTLDIDVDPNTGKYQLGVQFAYDAGVTGDKFNLFWGMLFKTKLTQQELDTLPNQLKWNLFDVKNNKFLETWGSRPNISKVSLRFGTVSAEGDIAKQIIGNQGHILLVFGTLQGAPLYNINVGLLCRTLSNYFMNITDAAKKCDAVSVSEIDAAQKAFCQESEEELLKYIKEGLITCEVAKNAFLKKGCGQLSCK